jgi:hypothetical protein
MDFTFKYSTIKGRLTLRKLYSSPPLQRKKAKGMKGMQGIGKNIRGFNRDAQDAQDGRKRF